MGQDEQVFTQRLRQTLTEVTAMRQTTLARGAAMQTALHAALQHEAARQELRGRGERANAIRRRLPARREVLRELAAERERAQIVVPPVRDATAVIHGRVTSRGGRGLADLCVELTDRSGKPLDYVEPAFTDGAGYYNLALPAEAAKQSKSGPRVAVRDSAGTVVYRSKASVTPEVGRRVRHSVRLSGADLRPPAARSGNRGSPAQRPSKSRRARGKSSDERSLTAGAADVLDYIETRPDFAAVGASRAKLERLMARAQLRSKRDLERFATKPAREVRDALRLPNLKGAEAFKRALGAAMGRS